MYHIESANAGANQVSAPVALSAASYADASSSCPSVTTAPSIPATDCLPARTPSSDPESFVDDPATCPAATSGVVVSGICAFQSAPPALESLEDCVSADPAVTSSVSGNGNTRLVIVQSAASAPVSFPDDLCSRSAGHVVTSNIAVSAQAPVSLEDYVSAGINTPASRPVAWD